MSSLKALTISRYSSSVNLGLALFLSSKLYACCVAVAHSPSFFKLEISANFPTNKQYLAKSAFFFEAFGNELPSSKIFSVLKI